MVLIIAGLDCEHCYEQIRLFDQKLDAAGVKLVVVTPESQPDSEKAAALSTKIISDPDGNWAGWFGLAAHDGPMHGTLLLDATGQVVWSDTGDVPNMNVEDLLQRVKRLPAL